MRVRSPLRRLPKPGPTLPSESDRQRTLFAPCPTPVSVRHSTNTVRSVFYDGRTRSPYPPSESRVRGLVSRCLWSTCGPWDPSTSTGHLCPKPGRTLLRLEGDPVRLDTPTTGRPEPRGPLSFIDCPCRIDRLQGPSLAPSTPLLELYKGVSAVGPCTAGTPGTPRFVGSHPSPTIFTYSRRPPSQKESGRTRRESPSVGARTPHQSLPVGPSPSGSFPQPHLDWSGDGVPTRHGSWATPVLAGTRHTQGSASSRRRPTSRLLSVVPVSVPTPKPDVGDSPV